MVILGTWNGRSIAISVKTNCLTVSLPGSKGVEVFSFDYEGRPWTAVLEGTTYRRGLDGKMVAKWRPPGGERQRRWLSQAEALQIEARLRRRVRALYAAIQSQAVDLNHPLPP